jgi:uncharacterized protein (DUF885 family)
MAATVEGRTPNPVLAELADEYFRAFLVADPVAATLLGIPGFDDKVADPSREASQRHAETLRDLEVRLAALDVNELNRVDQTTRSILAFRLRCEQDVLAAGLAEVAVTASVAGRLSMTLSEVPQVSLSDADRAESYLRRLAGLGGHFDALGRRYLQAKADGRFPTASGVQQAIQQLDDYVKSDFGQDPLLRPTPIVGDIDQWRARAERLVLEVIRPALRRLRTTLAEDLAPVGRDDDHVGVCNVPGGLEGYDANIRLFTTTSMSAKQIHDMGLDLVAETRAEIGQAGLSALGTADVSEILRRLRDDPSLRFDGPEQILTFVADAHRRAEQALAGWFRNYDLPACEVREMDPIQGRGGPGAYYLWPPTDGSRPGSLWVNTYESANRSRAGYEVLTFHEGVPGHHLQVAVSAGGDLPEFRRHRRLPAHSEGWGLYAERLADEMGLYSSEIDRLGMLASTALRACRLVVDTGIHQFGWPRVRAVEYMRNNTAMSDIEINNDVDRYIAAPAQALSYQIGHIRINELRNQARQQLGPKFDIAEFHHRVLAEGSLPLSTLDELIGGWVKELQSTAKR